MSYSFSVRVMRGNSPAYGIKVTVSYHGFFAGIDSNYTNDDGWATLSIENSEGVIETLYVDGDEVFAPGKVHDGDTLSFTI